VENLKVATAKYSRILPMEKITPGSHLRPPATQDSRQAGASIPRRDQNLRFQEPRFRDRGRGPAKDPKPRLGSVVTGVQNLLAQEPLEVEPESGAICASGKAENTGERLPSYRDRVQQGPPPCNGITHMTTSEARPKAATCTPLARTTIDQEQLESTPIPRVASVATGVRNLLAQEPLEVEPESGAICASGKAENTGERLPLSGPSSAWTTTL